MTYKSKYVTITARPYVTNSNARNQAVTGVTIHHCASTNFQASYKWLQGSTGSSANFMISQDGQQVAEIVAPERASWANANSQKNHSTLTYELTNLTASPGWLVSDATINKLILMLVEAAQHYGWRTYVRGKNFFLHTEVSQLGTSCPGPYVTGIADSIVARANELLHGTKEVEKTSTTLWQGRVNATALNVRSGPGTNYPVIDSFGLNQIVNVEQEKDGWLKVSQKYECWVSADYVVKKVPQKDYLVEVTGNGVNVRNSPWGKISGQVNKGEVFTVIDDTDKDFYKIKSGLYISKQFTKKI